MKKNKHLTVLAIAAVIFIIATIFSESTDHQISGVGEPVYPELLAKANDVTNIKIMRAAGELTLERDNEMWRVRQNNGYPADINKVRELVLGVANLVRVEPKTQKAENYPRIGLQDISVKDSPAVKVVLDLAPGNTAADLLIGNSKSSHATEDKKSYYIRTGNDPQSWLVDGKLPEKWEPKDWLDVNIFEVDRTRIKEVLVDHADGEKVHIHRPDSSVRDFILESLKPGEQVTAPFEVNNIATTFTKMTFDDVVSENDSGADSAPVYTAKLSTFDGLVVTFQPFKKGDIHLVKYSAAFDESAASSAPVTKDENAAATAVPEDPSRTIPKLMTPDEVKQEVSRYNAIWNGWMYQLPEFRIKNIGKKKADLLKKEGNPSPVH